MIVARPRPQRRQGPSDRPSRASVRRTASRSTTLAIRGRTPTRGTTCRSAARAQNTREPEDDQRRDHAWKSGRHNGCDVRERGDPLARGRVGDKGIRQANRRDGDERQARCLVGIKVTAADSDIARDALSVEAQGVVDVEHAMLDNRAYQREAAVLVPSPGFVEVRVRSHQAESDRDGCASASRTRLFGHV